MAEGFKIQIIMFSEWLRREHRGEIIGRAPGSYFTTKTEEETWYTAKILFLEVRRNQTHHRSSHHLHQYHTP
jgi:hypothetical protein